MRDAVTVLIPMPMTEFGTLERCDHVERANWPALLEAESNLCSPF